MRVEVYSSQSEDSLTCAPVDSKIPRPADAVTIRFIDGVDWEDCMKQHFELMGWKPYKPWD